MTLFRYIFAYYTYVIDCKYSIFKFKKKNTFIRYVIFILSYKKNMHIMRINCKGYTMSCIKIFSKYISRMMLIGTQYR